MRRVFDLALGLEYFQLYIFTHRFAVMSVILPQSMHNSFSRVVMYCQLRDITVTMIDSKNQ